MKVANVETFMIIIQRHDEGDVFDAEVMVFAKDINEALAHIAVNATLDRISNRGNAPFHLKEDVEEPF